MPIRRPAPIVTVEADDDEAIVMRDYVMARGAAAIAALDSAKADVIEAMALFVTPGDDKKGKQRKQLLDESIETVGIASRALEDAMEHIDAADMEAGEPWEEEDDDPEGAD